MKLINVSFSAQEKIQLFRLIGTGIKSFRCDPFSFNNWVYQCVGIICENDCLVLKNELHPTDFFGIDEDICWLEIAEISEQELTSGLANVKQIDIPYNEILKDIVLIQEEQKLFIHGELAYHVMLTRGLVFCFEDGREVSFEKTDPFSEEIEIRRGHNLVEAFTPKYDPNDWDDGTEMVVSQTTEHLNKL